MKRMQLEIGNKLIEEIDFLTKHIKSIECLITRPACYVDVVFRFDYSGNKDCEVITQMNNDDKLKIINEYYDSLVKRLERCKNEFEKL